MPMEMIFPYKFEEPSYMKKNGAILELRADGYGNRFVNRVISSDLSHFVDAKMGIGQQVKKTEIQL